LFVAHGSIAVSLSELSAEVMNANGFQGQTREGLRAIV